MSDKTPLEAEATGEDTATFEFFGRRWTVPTKRRLSHLKKMRDDVRAGVGTWDLLIAETFLSPEQFDALCEIDPSEAELDAFTTEIGKALGTGESSGNLKPSSASS